MLFRAHDRLLISASLIVIFAAFAFTITQGAGNDRYLTVSADDCADTRGELRPGAAIGPTALKKGCAQPQYSSEPVTLLLFGIGLTGFAYAVRRHFDRLS